MNIAQVPSDVFKMAYYIFAASSEGKMASVNPASLPPLVVDGEEISLQDHPFNRGFLTVAEHVEDPHRMATMQRLIGVMRLIHCADKVPDKIKNAFRRDREGNVDAIHESLLEACASCPLDSETGFDLNALAVSAIRIAHRMLFEENVGKIL